jgi:uncharacterized protein (TIGR03663 family)
MTQRFENRGRSIGLILLAILALAFILRSIGLELKPPHFDEGINGNFVEGMWSSGFYRYDPTNFHGPLYFYILQMAETIFGFGIFGLRFVNGLISLGIVAMVGAHRRFVGRAALWAALIVAVSPGFVFYSRYAIHESLFVFSHVLFSYGYLRWLEDRSRAAWSCMVTAVVIAVTTKETFFIFFATWVIAVLVNRAAEKIFKISSATQQEEPVLGSNGAGLSIADRIAISLIGVFVILALFTGFFMHLEGAKDMVTALVVWTKTGTAKTGHEKEFTYWLTLLGRYEWPFLVAFILSPLVFFQTTNRTLRWFALLGFGTWLAYSLIPYKTPWLILNMLWPLAFVFGFLITGRARFLETLLPKRFYIARLLAAIALVFTIARSASSMYQLNFHDFVNPTEPYVYVQTTSQFKVVMDVMTNMLKKRPEGIGVNVAVLNKDPWPMPWVLARYTHLTWGKAGEVALKDFSVILSDKADQEKIESGLSGPFFVMPFQIRDAYEGGHAYLSATQFLDVVPPGTPVQTFASGQVKR